MLKKLFGSLFGNKASEAPKPPSPSLPDIPPSDSLPNTKAPVHGISYPEFLGDRRDTGYINKFKTKVG